MLGNSNQAGWNDCGCCICIPQDSVAIIENFGKFDQAAPAGFFCLKCPGIWVMRDLVTLRVQQKTVEVETKTKDNVFVQIMVAVQFEVIPSRVEDAYYKLANPSVQIHAYVYDAVRSTIPNLTLDEVFEGKNEVSVEVEKQLTEHMTNFGYQIHGALIVDVSPAAAVKNSMNEINANKRKRIAAAEVAEAQKIFAIKRAEAEAESKYLQGEGIARQRRAIVEGLRDSVNEFSEKIEGMKAKDVLELVLITQYFDTLKDIGEKTGTSTVFVPHNPGALGAYSQQIRGTFK
ncbi:unnamed protein product [Amoebophrya sp. A120]|nr:unnamed protein product [Amoebophrya sp. A120]|eukprot:GSA120T00004652001.1